MKIESRHAKMTKVLTGIQGFDEITDGGLPRGRTTLVMGGPGCGKTVFALQSLVNAARLSKESSIFVAFEESTQQIVANAATFGWDLPDLARKKLFFLDARLSPEVVKSGEFDLIGMLNVLHAKATEIHATRIVFDGIDVLLGLLDDPAAERRELYRIRDWLVQTGLTGMITQKAGGNDADHRYEFLQFMVDCVIVLRRPGQNLFPDHRPRSPGSAPGAAHADKPVASRPDPPRLAGWLLDRPGAGTRRHLRWSGSRRPGPQAARFAERSAS
jgi:KaiC/GvpD/RAD55 family RecA-like ATPase